MTATIATTACHERTPTGLYLDGWIGIRAGALPCKRQVAGSIPAGGSCPEQAKNPGAKIARGLFDGNVPCSRQPGG
jgi:hypothetical protein